MHVAKSPKIKLSRWKRLFTLSARSCCKYAPAHLNPGFQPCRWSWNLDSLVSIPFDLIQMYRSKLIQSQKKIISVGQIDWKPFSLWEECIGADLPKKLLSDDVLIADIKPQLEN